MLVPNRGRTDWLNFNPLANGHGEVLINLLKY